MKYPKTIYATKKVGSNGIDCLDYRNFDEDVAEWQNFDTSRNESSRCG